MARKKAEVRDEDRPRDTRGSMLVDTRPGRTFVPPNEEETAAIVAALPKNLDPSAAQIERSLKRLVRLGKLRAEALGGAKAFAVEAIDKIESRTEPTDPIQASKFVNSRYFVGGEKEPESGTELEAEKISRTSGFKEGNRGVDPGADKMEHPRVRKLLALAMRRAEGRKAVRSRLLRQKREGTKLFAEDKEEEKKRRPPTVGERVAQIVRLPSEPASAIEEMAGGEYTGKGSRGVPKLADTGGTQRRPRVSTDEYRGPLITVDRAREIEEKTGKKVEPSTVRELSKRVATQKVRELLPKPSRKQALQQSRRDLLEADSKKAGVSGVMQGPLTPAQHAKMILEAHRMRTTDRTIDRPTRFEEETLPVQGPLRRLPRKGPVTSTGKPIEYKFEDSGRPMGMSPKKYEEVRTVEGVPFDKTMYAKLDRLAREGNKGAARVLAKLKTRGFGAKKGLESGEVKNPETGKVKFKTAAQKARDRAKQESRAMGSTATEEARKVMKGSRKFTGGKAAPVRMNLRDAAAVAERAFRTEAASKVGARGKMAGPLTKLQLAKIGERARRLSP